VVILPESNTEFKFIKMDEGLMGAQWKWGEPMVKVYGIIEMKQNRMTNVIDHVTSVFVKQVSEFSFNEENVGKDVRYYLYQNK